MEEKGKAIGLDVLLRPTDRFVVSSVPLTTMRPDTVQPQLVVLGTIGYDTRLTNTISARVSGRIERLYVRYRYQHIHKGEPLMDIYSPELETGEKEYLFLLKNDPANLVMIRAARQQLLLLGVGERQLDEVARTGRPLPVLTVYSSISGHIHEAGNSMPEGDRGMGGRTTTAELSVKEGMYVEKAQAVFQVFDVDQSWVLLSLFPGQEGLVHRGDPVEIVPETVPDEAFKGRVDLVEPLYRQGVRSLTVRVYFDNSRRDIPVGSAVKAIIRPASVVGNWLPRDAVLSLGTHRVVFLQEEGGFRAHAVTTGMTEGQRILILSGLGAKDSVAANAQFLVDSEDFIKINN
jgi:Cu(I)/Ag(I) efflux system membrane fusion protein